MTKIVIDLTPVLPGGENGGAKSFALELVKQLSILAPQDEFIILTSYKSHTELSFLDTHNVSRICTVLPQKTQSSFRLFLKKIISYLKRCLFKKAAPSAQEKKLNQLKPDLLFCPFTAPFYFTLNIPIISVIYDLQYLEYPYFFSSYEQQERDGHFRSACQKADFLICISEFTRQAVSKANANHKKTYNPQKITTIPIYITKNEPSEIRNSSKYENFLLYPANFWPHKNHKMLFIAFSIYCKSNPQSTLKLICPGVSNENQLMLTAALESMQIQNRVILPGYVSAKELHTLFDTCKALIYPSLYEGFGIPIIEAMLLKKPVLCSKIASLPEIAKDFAIYFDPRKPKEIAKTIEEIDFWNPTNSNDIQEKIQLGYINAQQYVGTEKMAAAYYSIFQKVLNESPSSTSQKIITHGFFEDGWIGKEVVVHYPPSKHLRSIEITCYCPAWHPKKKIHIEITEKNNVHFNNSTYILEAGETYTINHPISTLKSTLTLTIKKGIFRPKSHNMGEDTRWIGCLCKSCEMIFDNQRINLLQ